MDPAFAGARPELLGSQIGSVPFHFLAHLQERVDDGLQFGRIALDGPAQPHFRKFVWHGRQCPQSLPDPDRISAFRHSDIPASSAWREALPDARDAAHVRHEHVGDAHAAVSLLVVLDDGDHRPAHREPRAVERVHVSQLAAA